LLCQKVAQLVIHHDWYAPVALSSSEMSPVVSMVKRVFQVIVFSAQELVAR